MNDYEDNVDIGVSSIDTSGSILTGELQEFANILQKKRKVNCKMNVLHIISGGDSGGAKTHVFALLDALKKYVNVKIVCFIPGVFYQEIQHKDIQSVLFNQKNRMDLSHSFKN